MLRGPYEWGTFYLLIAKLFATKNINGAKKFLWSFCDLVVRSNINNDLKE